MKQAGFFIVFLLIAGLGKAQLNPVTWTFTAKKIDDKKYEVHMTATIQDGWHLFSQEQPSDAIANPTAFIINKNPLLEIDGRIKEVGAMEKFRNEKLDISANQYSNTVDFVQVVKLKAKAKTNLSGSVEFQTCDDKKCLPPKKVNFNVVLQ